MKIMSSHKQKMKDLAKKTQNQLIQLLIRFLSLSNTLR